MTPLPPTTPPPAGTPTDTPRTKELSNQLWSGKFNMAEMMERMESHANALERELAAALKEVARLNEAHDRQYLIGCEQARELAAAFKERDEARRILTQEFIAKNQALDELASLRQQLAGAEEAKGEVEANFNCFRCHDGHTPLYCLNCAGDLLKQSAPAAQGENQEGAKP